MLLGECCSYGQVHGRDESLPYQQHERESVGRPDLWPPRRGEDPPCDAKDKGAVMAGWREWVVHERDKGGRQPAPFPVDGLPR